MFEPKAFMAKASRQPASVLSEVLHLTSISIQRSYRRCIEDRTLVTPPDSISSSQSLQIPLSAQVYVASSFSKFVANTHTGCLWSRRSTHQRLSSGIHFYLYVIQVSSLFSSDGSLEILSLTFQRVKPADSLDFPIYPWWYDLARDCPAVSKLCFFPSSLLVDSCQIVQPDVSRDDLSPILNFLSSVSFVPSSSVCNQHPNNVFLECTFYLAETSLPK